MVTVMAGRREMKGEKGRKQTEEATIISASRCQGNGHAAGPASASQATDNFSQSQKRSLTSHREANGFTFQEITYTVTAPTSS